MRDCGCSVLDLAQIGGGVPDLLVGYRGLNYLIELKSIDEKGKMSDGAQRSAVRQLAWATMWRGTPVKVVTDLLGALTAVGCKTGGVAKASKDAPRILRKSFH